MYIYIAINGSFARDVGTSLLRLLICEHGPCNSRLLPYRIIKAANRCDAVKPNEPMRIRVSHSLSGPGQECVRAPPCVFFFFVHCTGCLFASSQRESSSERMKKKKNIYIFIKQYWKRKKKSDNPRYFLQFSTIFSGVMGNFFQLFHLFLIIIK